MPGLPIDVQMTGRTPEVWGKIPQRNTNFTGRKVLLEQLREGMAASGKSGKAVVLHALHGLGGVGKTQIAVEYAWRFRGEYELVWWISADQPVLLRSSLAALAPHLGVPSATAIGIEDCATAVVAALQRGHPYSKWLLIFDNANQPADLGDLLPAGTGHVLVTSRNDQWRANTIAVDVFSRHESVEFLRKRIPREISSDDADRLARELGDLPLALEQAGALQAETGMAIDEYLRRLNEQATLLLGEGRQSEYPVSMTAAWSLSVSQLKETLPEAIELLRCCSFFGPEPIPLDMFVPVGGGVGAKPLVGRDLRLRTLLSNPMLLSRAVNQLGRYALARIDDWNRTVQVHRLVQALLRDELTPKERERIRHEVHLLLATAVITKNPDDTTNWDRYAECLAHVDPSRVIFCTDPAVRKFCLDVVRYLYASGNYMTARSTIEECLKEWEKEQAPDVREILIGRMHRGIVLRELGEDTYELNRTTLQRMSDTLGVDDKETLNLSNSHGADLRARGDFQGALEHDRDSLDRHERIFGKTARETLRCKNNLAVDYGLVSNYQKAQDLYIETLQLQYLPGSQVTPLEVLIVRGGLARAVRLNGLYEDACNLGGNAVAFGRSELRPDHPWTLRMEKDLSIARRVLGQFDEALELAGENYTQEVRIFGPNHPDTLAAAMNVANALRSKGEVAEGLEYAQDAMRRYPGTYGESHPYYYGFMVNLALLLRTHDEPEAGRDLDQEAIEGLTERLGPDHHYTLTCALNLASDLAVVGDTARAVEIGRDTYRRLIALLTEKHPLSLAAAVNLELDLRAEGAGDEADSLRRSTLDIYEGTLGLDHPDVQAYQAGRRVDYDFDPPPI